MSTPTFPDFPGLDIKIKRGENYSTMVQTSASGKELRGTFWSTPRYHYEMTFNFLRQEAFSALTLADEIKALRDFFESVLGQWGAFYLIDPLDGISRKVRFEQDSLDLEQVFFQLWSSSLKFVSLK